MKLDSERVTRKRPPTFDFNAQCGRKKQSVIHLLADLENCEFLRKIINHKGGILEEIDLRA